MPDCSWTRPHFELRAVPEIRKEERMTYRIHPIVMGTKVFDKGMMT
jgi:hypothetical protein